MTVRLEPSVSEFVPIRGLRYHVRRWGAEGAPRLFLLHGWMDVGASFQFVVDALEGEWQVIAPDWRGFGQSEWTGRPYWFPDYVADLDALLTHYSPDEPARLVGASMGGNVACLYAGIRPQRVAKAVTLEGFGLAPTDPAEAPQRLRSWLEQLAEGAGFRHYPDFDALAARLRRDNPRLDAARAGFLARHLGRGRDGGGVELGADPCHKLVNPILYRIEEVKSCWRECLRAGAVGRRTRLAPDPPLHRPRRRLPLTAGLLPRLARGRGGRLRPQPALRATGARGPPGGGVPRSIGRASVCYHRARDLCRSPLSFHGFRRCAGAGRGGRPRRRQRRGVARTDRPRRCLRPGRGADRGAGARRALGAGRRDFGHLARHDRAYRRSRHRPRRAGTAGRTGLDPGRPRRARAAHGAGAGRGRHPRRSGGRATLRGQSGAAFPYALRPLPGGAGHRARRAVRVRPLPEARQAGLRGAPVGDPGAGAGLDPRRRRHRGDGPSGALSARQRGAGRTVFRASATSAGRRSR